MDAERWRAIVMCDATYDGAFYYGVQTTGIFCRPSCKSRTPKPEHVQIFPSVAAAKQAGFRPCKRCAPDALQRDEELTYHVKAVMAQRIQEPLTLQEMADTLHINPYHLHRTFKRMTKQTPAAYLRAMRVQAAQQWLADSEWSIAEVARRTGFSNVSHFTAVFHKQVGLTPSEYRRKCKLGRSEERYATNEP